MPAIFDIILTIAGMLSAGTASAAVYELIKSIERKNPNKREKPEIRILQKLDGKFVVEIESSDPDHVVVKVTRKSGAFATKGISQAL